MPFILAIIEFATMDPLSTDNLFQNSRRHKIYFTIFSIQIKNMLNVFLLTCICFIASFYYKNKIYCKIYFLYQCLLSMFL